VAISSEDFRVFAGIYPILPDNLRICVTDRPINYNFLFSLSRQKDINIFANVDIIFRDEELDKIEEYLREDECFALGRWNMMDQNWSNATLYDRIDAQDAWAFRGIPKFDCNFQLGIHGGDNRFAALANNAGYTVTNPCKSIKIYHYHITQRRTRNLEPAIEGPYLYLEPSSLREILDKSNDSHNNTL
jgi:hypothetical protein